MKPASFDYQRVRRPTRRPPCSATRRQARILAGGQSLMAVLNMRLARPQRWSTSRDRRRWPGCASTATCCTWAPRSEGHARMAAGARAELPLLALAFPHISHFQIRNRGTVANGIARRPLGRASAGAAGARREVCLRGARGARRGGGAGFLHRHAAHGAQADELVGRCASRSPRPARTTVSEIRGAPWRLRDLRRGSGGRRGGCAHRRRRCRRPSGGAPICRCSKARPSTTPSTNSPGRSTCATSRRPAPLRRQLVRRLGRRAADRALTTRRSA